MKEKRSIAAILFISLLLFASDSHSLPLSTSGRWVVDDASGQRVKLACVNWISHLQAMVVEGLHKRPLREIAGGITAMGFNCVRLTWATYMFTRPSYGNRSVAESLGGLGLSEAKEGVARNNPELLNLSLVEAYEAVVDELGRHGVMVVLDNHVSKPKWCCAEDDGNGFFGDKYFHPKEWLQGLTKVAHRFKDKSQVVAMSMRNELRGPNQTEHIWYKQIRKGGRTIHSINPNLLVIVSGLEFDTDLSFLKQKPLKLKLPNKVVFEAHWYSFSSITGGVEWTEQPLNQICDNRTEWFESGAAFVGTGSNPAPFFLSEFGIDLRGVNPRDNRFFGCFLAFVAQRDLDWALWTLQGSYYYRDGVVGQEETYGVLDYNWDKPRNPKFLKRIRILQDILQDPNSNVSKYHLIFHPRSGRCVSVKGEGQDQIHGRNCKKGSRWSHDGNGGAIRLMGSGLCLKAVGDGLPAKLSTDCSSPQARWKLISKSKLHIAAMDEQGKPLCLDGKNSNSSSILTRTCICALQDGDDSDLACLKNPQRQWFKFVPSNLP
ncbi:glycosyl hydrolase 5 family protein-like [Vitis riparia]|uniref:glycosyl hydrolase 5 family protein-like n=1 Tax=Vitis riparia TaxID=96939 RepID=UPI00155AB341|nr:glycosyl hydrolase 5 family protein-like [Vitis riparia]